MAIITILDTETTGVDASAKMVEFAAIKLMISDTDPPEFLEHTSFLINPGVPIPPEASAVHHLTAAHLSEAYPYSEALAIIESFASDSDYLVAHNAAFDSRFIPLKNPWLCTLRLARQLVDSPAYGNQVLRYALNLDVKSNLLQDLAPHRALYDVVVTTALFKHLLGVAGSLATLQDKSAKPIFLKKMPFGKYKGKAFEDIPLDYLRYMTTGTGLDPDLLQTIKHHMERRKNSYKP